MKPCDQPCPKCGSDDISAHYYRTGDKIELPIGENNYGATEFSTYAGRFSREAIKEHLSMRCRFCRYRWEVAPMDRAFRVSINRIFGL